MASLVFYYASMDAGKSTQLLQASHNYNQKGMRTLLLTSALDDRFGESVITSRLGVSAPATGLSVSDSPLEIFENQHAISPLSCVLVDEAQFMTESQVWSLSEIVDRYDVPVLCYGLRNDYQGKPFPGSAALMAIADRLKECTNLSMCVCGSSARMVIRTDEHGSVASDGEQIAIEQVGDDASVIYHSVCRRHFKEARQSGVWPAASVVEMGTSSRHFEPTA